MDNTNTTDEPRLGCRAYELEPGDEFSFDEGLSWVVAETVWEDPAVEADRLVVNYRDDSNAAGTVELSSRRHVLLERAWKGPTQGTIG